ncbi:hypothetical protein VTI74DRAFT_7578 [Chaetomium olivicolor]
MTSVAIRRASSGRSASASTLCSRHCLSWAWEPTTRGTGNHIKSCRGCERADQSDLSKSITRPNPSRAGAVPLLWNCMSCGGRAQRNWRLGKYRILCSPHCGVSRLHFQCGLPRKVLCFPMRCDKAVALGHCCEADLAPSIAIDVPSLSPAAHPRGIAERSTIAARVWISGRMDAP